MLPVVFEMPAELITVVDIKLPPYSGGDVCLIPRYLAFGVNPVAAHISRYVTDRENLVCRHTTLCCTKDSHNPYQKLGIVASVSEYGPVLRQNFQRFGNIKGAPVGRC